MPSEQCDSEASGSFKELNGAIRGQQCHVRPTQRLAQPALVVLSKAPIGEMGRRPPPSLSLARDDQNSRVRLNAFKFTIEGES
jgi:hypothetical protein